MKKIGFQTLFVNLLAVLMPVFVGCGGATKPTATLESIEDVSSIAQRGDGNFDVVCKSGVKEIATASQIQSSQVCQVHPAAPLNILSMQLRNDGRYDVICVDLSRIIASSEEVRASDVCHSSIASFVSIRKTSRDRYNDRYNVACLNGGGGSGEYTGQELKEKTFCDEAKLPKKPNLGGNALNYIQKSLHIGAGFPVVGRTFVRELFRSNIKGRLSANFMAISTGQNFYYEIVEDTGLMQIVRPGQSVTLSNLTLPVKIYRNGGNVPAESETDFLVKDIYVSSTNYIEAANSSQDTLYEEEIPVIASHHDNFSYEFFSNDADVLMTAKFTTIGNIARSCLKVGLLDTASYNPDTQSYTIVPLPVDGQAYTFNKKSYGYFNLQIENHCGTSGSTFKFEYYFSRP
jgi:archaellum component FlaF (FlaF/FlaG flagellin family)